MSNEEIVNQTNENGLQKKLKLKSKKQKLQKLRKVQKTKKSVKELESSLDAVEQLYYSRGM